MKHRAEEYPEAEETPVPDRSVLSGLVQEVGKLEQTVASLEIRLNKLEQEVSRLKGSTPPNDAGPSDTYLNGLAVVF